MRKILLFTLLIPFILGGCNNKNSNPKEGEQYINVLVNQITLEEEQQYQIQTEIIKKGTIVFYSSNNEEVASVSDDGLVTAKKEGEATINIRGGRDTYSLFVTVVPYQAHDSLQIILEKDTFTIGVGDNYVLPLAVKYGNDVIENPNLTITPEVSDIIKISDLDLSITGKSVGTTRCLVTASYNQEEASKIFTVIVY